MDSNALEIVTAVIAVVALAGCVVLYLRVNNLHKRLFLLQGHADGADFFTVVSDHIAATQALDAHVGELDVTVKAMRKALVGAVQRVGVVRYDAFADMGGHLSFSAAFLDERGTGVVMTCINSRNEARLYAKGVLAGKGDENPLSEEEVAAIRLAMDPTNVHHEMA